MAFISFKTRSYFEWLWNAIRWVEYKTRNWDIFNLDYFIVERIKDWVPIILEYLATPNEIINCKTLDEDSKKFYIEKYKEIEELGKLAERLIQFEYWYEFMEEEFTDKKRFQELLSKRLFDLWF